MSKTYLHFDIHQLIFQKCVKYMSNKLYRLSVYHCLIWLLQLYYGRFYIILRGIILPDK